MLKDAIMLVLFLVVVIGGMLLIHFVVASYQATGTGVIRWAEGRDATLELIKKLLSYIGYG